MAAVQTAKVTWRDGRRLPPAVLAAIGFVPSVILLRAERAARRARPVEEQPTSEAALEAAAA